LFGGWGSPYGSSYPISIYTSVGNSSGTAAISRPANGWPGNPRNSTANGIPGGSSSASPAMGRPASGAPMDPDTGRTMRKPDVTPEAGRPIHP
jgi:hypothetical protein